MKWQDTLELSRKDLRKQLEVGYGFDPMLLKDTEYKGIALGMPKFVEKLSWKKFKKVFHFDTKLNRLRGWNIRIEQNDDLAGDYLPMQKKGGPFTFGHFGINRDQYKMPGGHLQNYVMLDYGQGLNSRFDFTSRLRDPIVSLSPNNVDVLLGWSYLQFGPVGFGTGSYFCLIRDQAVEHIAYPTRYEKA